jgi:TP901 family phage tail tape measure protein
MVEKKKLALTINSDLMRAETDAAIAIRKEERALKDNAKAVAEKAKADAKATQNSSSARYALYDIARAYGIVSVALLSASGFAIKAAADMESAFTSVERTLSVDVSAASVQKLKGSLMDLSTQIPKTFAEVSTIATLGNQLGVAEKDLVGFVKTVSEFSVATGISIEQTSQAFGVLGNLLDVPVARFKNLSSSIVQVGVNSVATEPQIIAVAQQIAAVSNGAGFAADEVIGLSGAFASLKVSPEQARSSLTTYFNVLNAAVAGGGKDLDNFAKITGTTAGELEALVRSGDSGKAVLDKFLGSLNSYGSVEITKAFEELGLNGLRVDNTFRRLAQNPVLVGSVFEDAAAGMDSGTEAQRQYAKVADDLNSAIIVLQSAFSNLVAQMGSDVLPGFGKALNVVRDLVVSFTDMANNPVGKFIFQLGVSFAGIVGIFLAYKSAALVAAGSTLALARAQALLGTASTSGAFTNFARAAFAAIAPNAALATSTTVNTTATVANTAANASKNATLSAGVASTNASTVAITAGTVAAGANTVAVSGMTRATNLFSLAVRAIPGWGWALAGIVIVASVASNMMELGRQTVITSAGLADIAARNAAGGSSMQQLASDAGSLSSKLKELTDSQLKLNSADEAARKKTNYTDNSGQVAAQYDAATLLISEGTKATKEQFGLLDEQLAAMVDAGNIDEVTKLIADTKAPVLDVITYMPGYVAALDAARIAQSKLAREKLSEQWGQSVSAVNDAEKALSDYSKTAKSATKSVRTLSDYASDLGNVFKRSFDIRFGSQSALDNITDSFANLRKESEAARISLLSLSADKSVKEYFLSIANAYGDTLRAGQLTADIAKINQDIADAQSNSSKELKGNSSAAIKNRSTITGMVGSYDSYIQSLADSGASQKKLQAAIRQGKADFIAQATQLGFNGSELRKYSSHFDDLSTSVTKVPKNVTVTANVNPALQALNEMVAKSKSSGSSAGSAYGASYYEGLVKAAKKGANDIVRVQIAPLRGRLKTAYDISEKQALYKQIADLEKQLFLNSSGKAFASGGYTGSGGKFDVAGLVHKGEYVVPKSQVNQSTGLPYEGALSQMKNPSYFNGGPVTGNSGMMVVSLSPEDRGLLRQIGGSGQVVLYANNEAIARSSSAGSKSIVASGGRL